MKKLLYATVFLFAITSVFNLTAQNKKAAVGKWKYEVAQAPKGFDKGILEIKELKDTLSGVVNFNSGETLKLHKLTLRNDTIWANIYVDYETVEVVATMTNLKMKGSVHTSMGEMSFKADKIVSSKEKK